MTLRIRKWWHAGAEVTIRLTECVGDDDGKLLQSAVHAFSKALSARSPSAASAGNLPPADPLNPIPKGET